MSPRRHRPPHLYLCVLTPLFRIHVSNPTSSQEIDIFDGPPRDAAAGPAQDFVDEWPPQGAVPNGPSNDVLRNLAFFYLREPNSQVSLIHLEPGDANGVRVAITLELSNL